MTYADPQTAVAPVRPARARRSIGNLAAVPPRCRSLARRLSQRAHPAARPDHAARGARSSSTGCRAASGWSAAASVGEGLALRETLERSLLIALVVAGLLGLLCGLILAQYVGRRIGDIAAVADRISARDLTPARAAVRRRRRVRPPRPADQRDARPDQRADGGAPAADRHRSRTTCARRSAGCARRPMPRPRPSDPKEQEELLGSVIRQADSLMRILTAVLEISRSEALTGRNQFAWFDVGELAAELTEMYEPLAEERGAALKFDRPARADAAVRPPPAARPGDQQPDRECDPLRRVGRRDPGRACSPAEAQIRIEVADRGPGIPEATSRRGACAASAGSIRAAPTKAPASAWRWPRRSPTSTTASCCWRTIDPGLLTALELAGPFAAELDGLGQALTLSPR